MKLKVLVDNNTYIDQYYLGEPAVSYYIEEGDKRILFDTGYSDIFITNAEKMGIDLAKTDIIAISHGHNDHTRGLTFFAERFTLSRQEIIAHPQCFHRKQCEGQDIGSPLSVEELEKMAMLNLSREPVYISDKLIFLGEIPMKNDFEEIPQIGTVTIDGRAVADELIDDTALAYKTDQGIFIITGCSHRGICNIAEYAKEICGSEHILGIIGGFHLFKDDQRLQRTIAYFQQEETELFYPCHCVALSAKVKMCTALNVSEVGVGMEITL